ncbi:uncharacterized protein LOC130728456 [Lotus japonicus]|uniref:uncharacterized protein LOC130728456 n=1 Tax=Lotus japonicus TaxID=34305 RepID=UPI00259117E4|nr:uncharacterized protein LOC130728456 [Lotus japonicus]
MGMNMSFLGGKALSTTQMLSLVMNKLYKQFVDKDIKDFDAFKVAIIDTFNTINMALPGKHYDSPSYEDVKDFFNQWKEANEETKKVMFIDFMNKNVTLNKVDESIIVTGIVAPPAAMVAKKTGQTVPQLTFMNAIPDVVFVPSATVLALIAVRILGLMFRENNRSKFATCSHMDAPLNNIPPPPVAQDAPSTLNNIPPPPVAQDAPLNNIPPPPVAQDAPSTLNNIPPPPVAQDAPSTLNNIPPPPVTQDAPSTLNNIPPLPVAQDAPVVEPETAPDMRQHTAKGKFCALCNKFH